MIDETIKEARYYKKLPNDRVRCELCPHMCGLSEGELGKCRLRENRDGTLYAVAYGKTVTVNIDPVEKKPLYHFMPASSILSIGPNGCSFKCDFCQNWHISMEESPTDYVAPEKLVELAKSTGSIGVAFTYTEPLVWFEYVVDAAAALRENGLKSILVTNGFINEGPALELAPLIDGFNIDLKSIRDDFYKKYCDGGVEPVKRFIEIANESSHIEVTNLVIPGLNDSPEDIDDLVDWLAGVSDEIPLHFSRFFPQFRMRDRPPTPQETLERAYKTAVKKMKYVYIGNIFIEGTEDTVCPSCGAVVVRRKGYSVETFGEGGVCPSCGTKIKGVW